MGELRYLIALVAATFFYVFIAVFYKIGVANSVFFASLLWLLPLAIRLGEGILQRVARAFQNRLKKNETRLENLSEKLHDIKRERAYLEEKLTNLSKLYTITKEMSFDVRFGELFGSLGNFLEDNFNFGKSRIVLFRYENGENAVDRVYEISGESKDFIQPELFPAGPAKLIAELKKPAFLKNGNDLCRFGFDPKARKAIVIPLIIQKRITSAILVENTDEGDYDKFLIFAHQVALQIERISLFEDIERLSITDGLTGTFLRRYFLERFESELSRTRQSGMGLSFIIIDLDHFKECNDTFGHLVGDVVLKEVAGVLKKNVREIDLVGRFGGEEFCALLPETGKSEARVIGERIRKAVEDRTINAYDEILRMTVSVGISSFPEDSNEPEGLVESADRALYEAKRAGRNRVCG